MCRPPGNRDPQPDEIETCRPYLDRQIELIEPKVICTLGNFATKLLTRSQRGITRVHGRPQVHEIGGRTVRVFPLYHPAAALRSTRTLEELREDFAGLPGAARGAAAGADRRGGAGAAVAPAGPEPRRPRWTCSASPKEPLTFALGDVENCSDSPMAYYIEFATENGPILVEAEEMEVQTPPGIEKAGLFGGRKDGGEAVAKAQESFETAIKRVIGENVRALQQAVGDLAKAPDQVELTFGLKATGEAGNIAIGKLGGEANFQLRLLWGQPVAEEQAPPATGPRS